MAVWVLNKRLQGSIRPRFSRQTSRAAGIQMRFPLVQRIDDQRQMPATVVRMDGQVTIADQVKFLILAESKPGAREIKCRPVHGRKPQRVPIKGDARVDIRDMRVGAILSGGNIDLDELSGLLA